MVEVQLLGLVFDLNLNTLLFQFVMPTIGIIGIIIAFLNYRKKPFSNSSPNQSKKMKIIICPPDNTPSPSSDFVNRNIEQEKLLDSLISNKKNMIVIQGMAGIGKTELAAKVREKIKNEYVTYWKTIREEDDFKEIISSLACFLKDKTLNKHIENDDPDSIIDHIINLLNSKRYILFFDNYHNVYNVKDSQKDKVEYYKIDELFSKLKDNLKNSTIILITRVVPEFIRECDIIQKNIIETIEEFDIKTTEEYLSKKGIILSQEQFDKINNKIGGYPMALFLLAKLIEIRRDIEDIIEDLPKGDKRDKGDIGRYLWKEVFTDLSEEEQEIFEFLSVLRAPIKADDLSQIIYKKNANQNVKQNLFNLYDKLLVKKKKNYYYLHDLLKEFCYNYMDVPKRNSIHKLIGEYYKSQKKTQENLVEVSHHLIKNCYGEINDDIIEYFLSMPDDTYTLFIINEILKQNEIKSSSKIFNLFDKFINSKNVQIANIFVLSYGDYFEKIYRIKNWDSFEVFYKILQIYKKYDGVLDSVSQSIKEIAEKHPKESVQIWKKVIDINNMLTKAVVIYINDIKKSDELIIFLKDIMHQTHDESLKQKIMEIFEKWGITEYKRFYITDHLKNIRELPVNESIDYIEKNYKIMNPHFTVQALSEIIDYDKPKVVELIRNVVDYHKESSNMVLFLASDVLSSSLEQNDLNYINLFLKNNDKYALIVGIRTLDILSKKVESERILEYLNPFLEHENKTIKKISEITKKVIMDKNYANQRIRKDFHSFFKFFEICTKPKNIISIASMIKTEFRPTAPFVISVWTWGTIKTIENYDTNEILDVGESALEYSNPVMLDASKWAMDKLQTEPKEFANNLYTFGYKNKKMSYKHVSIPWIIMMGDLVPETVDEYLREIMTDEDEAVLSLLGNLRLYKTQDKSKREEILRYLINHKNKDISGFADFLLDGLNKTI